MSNCRNQPTAPLTMHTLADRSRLNDHRSHSFRGSGAGK
jgi:hypothetical protein